MKKWQKRWMSCWQENKFLVKPYLVVFLIYLVGASALLLAGVHYADDIARTNYGYAGWNGFSRYLSTLLAYGLHADGYLANIAPLPQLLAVAILALASVMMIGVVVGKEIFKGPVKKWIWSVIAVVPLGLSPYMLECLAYQYDSVYMAIAVLFAVWPLMFRSGSRWVYGFAIAVGVLAICMTYQAAIGILPMLVVMVAVRDWNEKRQEGGEVAKVGCNKTTVSDDGIKGKAVRKWVNLKFVAFSAVVFLVTLVFFQKVLMKPRDAYASNSLPEIQDLIPKFFEHLGQYFNLVWQDFKIWWLVLIGVVCVGFVVMLVMRSRKKKIVAGIVGLVSLVMIFVLAFAIYAVLDKPLFATRAMFPLGVAIAIVGVYAVTGAAGASKNGADCKSERLVWLWRVPVMVIAWCFVIFALTFGNALKEQENYRNEMADMVISDLNEMSVMKDGVTKYIQVKGNMGFSPVILHMPSDDTILQRLLMPTYSEYVPWMAYRVTRQSGFNNLVFDEEVDLSEKDLPVLKDTVFYRISGNKEGILVEFKSEQRFNVIF